MGRARNGPRPETKTGIQTPPRPASRSGNPKPSTPVLSYGYWFLESFSHRFFSLPLLFLRSRSFAREGDGRALDISSMIISFVSRSLFSCRGIEVCSRLALLYFAVLTACVMLCPNVFILN
ncbi:unnamed protein product [Musa banksii]